MTRRVLILAAVLVAAVPSVALEQTFRLEAGNGKEIAQHIPVPVDRPGELIVEASWTGSRGMRFWIEDHRGRDLARWSGVGAGRVAVTVTETMADPSRPMKVRIRTIGRVGSVDGTMTITFPSLADPPEEPEPEPGEGPTTPPEPEPEPEASGPGTDPEAPTAGTRWPAHVAALATALEDESQKLALRAMLVELARIARAYVALGPALPPRADPEGEPTEAELERSWVLDDLGREISAMVRLADESSMPEETATRMRRLMANMSELSRRREGRGERAEGVDEALAALSRALDALTGTGPDDDVESHAANDTAG